MLILSTALAVVTALGIFSLTRTHAPVTETVPLIADEPIVENSVSRRHAIAVMPFDNHSNLAADEFFTDGIHSDLLTQISKIKNLTTISRTSVMGYRDSTKSIPTIGKELNAVTILEGGVQRAGDEIRVNVQLVKAETDEPIWAESYTRKLSAENIFAIQSEIALAVATELETVLSLKEQQSITRLPTQNLAALEAYYRAKASTRINSREGHIAAGEHLRRAVQLDPQFASALAELATNALILIYWAGLPVEGQIGIAQPLIERATKLDGNLSVAYIALGTLNIYKDNFTAAELAYQKAIDLNPNSAGAYGPYGRLKLWRQNEFYKAVEILTKLVSLDPQNEASSADLVHALLFAGRVEQARALAEELIRRKPGYSRAYMALSDIQFAGEHKYAESLTAWRRAIELDPGVPMSAVVMGGLYLDTGHKEQAIQWFEHAIKLAPESHMADYAKARILEAREKYDEAFEIYRELAKRSLYMHALFQAGMRTNREPEVLDHFRTYHPIFFTTHIKVDASNFQSACAVGWLLNETDEREQAAHLLQQALNVTQVAPYGGWYSKHENWETRIYLAMQNHEGALDAFSRHVAEGYHSAPLFTDPEFKLLADEPEYQRLVKIVEAKLVKERELLREMEANGELDLPGFRSTSPAT